MIWRKIDDQHWKSDLQRIVLSMHNIENPYTKYQKTSDGYRLIGEYKTLEEAQS